MRGASWFIFGRLRCQFPSRITVAVSAFDNVIEVDPANANYVYAGCPINYDIGSAASFRSDDGGATWKNSATISIPTFTLSHSSRMTQQKS